MRTAGWRAGLLGAALVAGVTALIASEVGGPPEPAGAGEVPLAPAPDRSAAEPVPLLLVPGWFDTDRDLAALRIRFVAAGWPAERVDAMTFADPTGGNRSHAEQIDSAVTVMLERTGAPAVDIVAHSMGGLATRWYLRGRPRPPVRRVAFLASPHEGTLSAHLAWGEGSDDMLPGSAFLDSLNAGAPVPEGVDAITVRTPIDTHVIPPESATLPGVPDYVVCCPTHDGLLRDLEVFRIVRGFLEGPGRDGGR